VSGVRSDWAVVLARGASSRMGRAKGLCRLPGDQSSFLAHICTLHRRVGHQVAVVTLPELDVLYRDCVPAGAVDAWILHPAGGGTAATCLAAASGLDGRASHLWFHPVDLPLVVEATLRTLADLSRDDPGTILVPRHAGERGHPVVSPLSPWMGLWPADHPGAMKDLIDRCETDLHYADVPDPGIRRDFDYPEDLGGPA